MAWQPLLDEFKQWYVDSDGTPAHQDTVFHSISFPSLDLRLWPLPELLGCNGFYPESRRGHFLAHYGHFFRESQETHLFVYSKLHEDLPTPFNAVLGP